MKKPAGILFLEWGVIALLLGASFGVLGAYQFVDPDFLESTLPFYKMRPLHVSLVVAWIFMAAVGIIYHHLPQIVATPWRRPHWPRLHFYGFIGLGTLILASYFMGLFYGREYWEYPPVLSIGILLLWLLLLVNYFSTLRRYSPQGGRWPVYVLMWAVGITFFFLTFTEAHLWIWPGLGRTVIHDLTVQWKAYGALVASWNQLVYGVSIFVMERLARDPSISRSPTAYALFFLGVFNAILNWSHHIYILPTAPWIRYVGYAVSMTELIILGKMIWDWGRRFRSSHEGTPRPWAYRFMIAADAWITLNLALAIAMSIPAVNIYTHGTHVTVAHAMGSTIGINTTILWAALALTWTDRHGAPPPAVHRLLAASFGLFNGGLLLFWGTLLLMGFQKGIWTIEHGLPHLTIMQRLSPHFIVLFIGGLIVYVGLLGFGWGLLRWRRQSYSLPSHVQ